jgi:acetyl esterase/lipase
MPERRPSEFSRRAFLAGATAVGASVLAGCAGSSKVADTIVRDRIAYGAAPSQMGDLSVPEMPGLRPVMILVHGGYWRLGIDHHELDEIADSLGQAGYAVWNIDYRRLGEGGGWTATFDDVAAAIDTLATLVPERPIDLARVGIMGHSAGGQLALWAAARKGLPAGAPWSAPAVAPIAAVSLAGIVDLAMAATSTDTGEDAVKVRASVIALLEGTPAERPDRYAVASPIERLPLALPQLLVHGARDVVVPIAQSRAYVTAAADEADRVRLIELPAADHYDVIRIGKPGWSDTVSWLRTNVSDAPPAGG